MNFMKEGEEVCRYVNFNTFKSIYGHGMELKFVKLLFLFLKKQIDKFIEQKNASAKCNLAAQKKKMVKHNNSSLSMLSDRSHSGMPKPMQRHGLIDDIEKSRLRSQARNQEHNFYQTALHC